jgi:hypothetical protein
MPPKTALFMVTPINPQPKDPPRPADGASFPIFIVGHERSGTTLMAATLDRHSRIAVPPETHFFNDLCPAELADSTGEPPVMVNYCFRSFRIRDLQISREDILARLNKTHPTWRNFFLETLKLYAESRGKELVGEKTPNHWRETPQILKLFPDSKIIWLVRDGRDTVLSLMNTPWKRHSNLGVHALQWKNTIEKMIGFESQFPDRILRVKFENLVTAPQAELQRVCQFIGVDFESQQLDPSTKTGVVPNWEMPWKNRVFTQPDPSRIGTAARELPTESLDLLNKLMRETLGLLGYETDQISTATRDRIAS